VNTLAVCLTFRLFAFFAAFEEFLDLVLSGFGVVALGEPVHFEAEGAFVGGTGGEFGELLEGAEGIGRPFAEIGRKLPCFFEERSRRADTIDESVLGELFWVGRAPG